MSKAYIIDVTKQEIREIEYRDLQTAYQEIGCQFVALAHEFENGDVIFVDDEGLLKEPTEFFSVSMAIQPNFAGNGVLIGAETYDSDGEYVGISDAKTTLEELQKKILFVKTDEPVPPKPFNIITFE